MLRIRSSIVSISLAVAGLVLAAAPGRAETLAADAKLPEPVEKAFRAAYPNGEIHKVDAEREEGVMVYDFEFKDGTIEKETDIAADGTVLEYTIVIDSEAVPAAAMKTIHKYAKDATIDRLEHIEVSYHTAKGKAIKLAKTETNYAAEMTKGNKHGEIVVNATGGVVESPDWETIAQEKAAEKAEK